MPFGLERLGLGVFVDGFRDFQRQMKDMSKSVKGLSDDMDNSSGADRWADSLTKVGKTGMKVGGVMTAALTGPILGVAAGAASAAAESERYRNALIGLSGGADEAAKYIEAIQSASMGAINSTQAMSMATRALTFDVTENAEDMRRLTQVAITLGRAQGLDATRAVSDLTVALGRQSPMILDNLGITMKLSEAYEGYAEKNGIAVSAMTATQKRAAFVSEALAKGTEVATKLGGVTEDLGIQQENLQSQMHDLKVEIGRELLPVMVDLMGVVSSGVSKFADLDEEGKKVILTIGAIGVVSGPTVTALGALISAGGVLVRLLPDIATGFSLVASGTGMLETASLGAGAAVGSLVLPLTTIATILGGQVFVWKRAYDNWTLLKGAWDTTETPEDKIEFLRHATFGLRKEVEAWLLLQQEIPVASELASGSLNDYAEMARHLDNKTGEAKVSVRELKDQLRELPGDADPATTALDELAGAAEEVEFTVGSVAAKFGEMAPEDWREQAWQLAQSLNLNSAELTTLAKKLGIADQQQIAYTVRSHKLAEMLDAGKISSVEFAEQMAHLSDQFRTQDTVQRDLNTQMSDHKMMMADGKEETDNIATSTETATTKTEEFTSQTLLAKDSVEEAIGVYVDEEEQLGLTTEATDIFKGSVEDADEQTINLSDNTRWLARRLQEADPKLENTKKQTEYYKDSVEIASWWVDKLGENIKNLPDSKTIDIYINTHGGGGQQQEGGQICESTPGGGFT